jgi:hypothetical protein
MRDLSFGARISDSFVELLRRQIVMAHRQMPGTSPCLCAEEKPNDPTVSRGGPQAIRIDLSKDPKIIPVNRLVPPTSPKRAVTSKERVWVLRFGFQHPAQDTFNIDGMQLHISKRAQAELKGARLFCVFGEIVVKYVRI